MTRLSQTSSTDPPHITAQRPFLGRGSRKSASADCVEVTGSRGQEVKVAVRLASSEHSTLGGRMTSSRRLSKIFSRNHRGRSRRRPPPATSSKPDHVTDSLAVTSSGGRHGVTSSTNRRESPGMSRESPPVTSSPGNLQGPPRALTSSVISQQPRGRTSCKQIFHAHHRTESPAMTSSGKPQEPPRRTSSSPSHEECPFLQAISRNMDTPKKPDPVHRSCVRSTSVPPPSSIHSNPFSPFWNFLFKERRQTEDDGEEDHVCNTIRRPRKSWFGSSAVITNVYLSTVNRWIGVWPTAASFLAVSDREVQRFDDGGFQEENSRYLNLRSQVDSRFNSSPFAANVQQV